ncbi:hypothetical protein JMJ35_006233 [Cladonia borealis]|uniref:3-oxoacyl-[acyl-carrier-protein] synthase n=1 Tax=Cladonia borealis TaxID=184061 RepID=A0AA39QYT4_9LECA|nr:hypothetical protein JMJ35_006233 [Cladonia borealis]
MQRVVVTGLGAVTPLGIGVQRTWKRLVDGHCGVVSLKDKGKTFEQQQCQVAGLVPEGKKEDGGWTVSEWLSGDEQRRMSKFMGYAMAASQEALDDAGWKPKTEEEQEMTGICMGSGIGSLEEQYDTSIALDKGGPKKVSPLFVPKLLINLAAGHISMKYGLKGPNHAVTTACTTGAHSIGDASRFISHGDASIMLAGGSESCIHPLAFIGFERSRSLTTSFNSNPPAASRPFDAARSGFVIGEGAAMLVLESLPHALARNANIYAEIVGYGTSADAYHMTAPPPDGNGAFRAMRLALKNAKIAPKEVDYINAHATSTPLGDLAENRAIKRLMLGDENGKERAGEVNVSSTKGAMGHLLGAAGAVEAVFSILAIRDGVIPPTLNLTDLDGPEFDCNYVPLTAQERKVDVVLSNSFGFGGTNATLCFKRHE